MNKKEKYPLISIITPYFNTKKSLFDKCIESVSNQTYFNIEWIIIDDGSDEEYSSYLDDQAVKNSFMKVFHQKNSGPAIARNFALSNMRGKYFTFLDSDDYLQEDFIEKLYFQAVETGSDIVVGNMLYIDEVDGKLINRGENKQDVTFEMTEDKRYFILDSFFRKKQSKIKLSEKDTFISSEELWTVDNMGGKLYNADVHGKICLCPKVIHSQDNIYCLDTLLCSKKISFVKNVYYYYIRNEGSHSLKRKGIEKYQEYFKELYLRLIPWPEIFYGKLSNMILDIAYHLSDNVSFFKFYRDLKGNLNHPLLREYAGNIKLEYAAFHQQKRTLKALKYNLPFYLAVCVYVGKIKIAKNNNG